MTFEKESLSDGSDGALNGFSGVFVLLPVLNEIQNIGPLLDQIERELTNVAYTIGILDDGSKDGTAEYVEQRARTSEGHLHLIRRQKTTRGSQRGGALFLLMEWGLQYTAHDVFVEMDGDLSHRPEELREGIDRVASGACDVAIASKYVPGSRVVNRPVGRLMVSRISSMAVGTLISRKIRDYSNGYRFYSRAAAAVVAEHEIRYGSPIYLSEVLAMWLKQGLRVIEFPTTYIGRNEGLSKLRIIDLVKAAIACFEIAVRYHLTGFARRTVRMPAERSVLSRDA
jgi:dolichol-phosphate mannosyltransferase